MLNLFSLGLGLTAVTVLVNLLSLAVKSVNR